MADIDGGTASASCRTIFVSSKPVCDGLLSHVLKDAASQLFYVRLGDTGSHISHIAAKEGYGGGFLNQRIYRLFEKSYINFFRNI